MQTVLVVEDDPLLAEGICYALQKAGYQVSTCSTCRQARMQLEKSPDLVLLDINLPDGDGRGLLEQLRRHCQVPVILLTARNTEQDMMMGFEAGCDDYVTKPFSLPVLVKKIQAVLKRTAVNQSKLILSGDLSYDFATKMVYKRGQEVRLTATENRLLEMFLAHRGQVLTREQIISRIWDDVENYVDENTLNVNIRRLREKLEDDPKNPIHIKTVFGIGYKWSDNES